VKSQLTKRRLPVILPPPVAQLSIHFALDIHEDHASSKADSNHDELGPKRPVELVQSSLLGRPVDQHIQRPDDARDRDHMESNRAEDLADLYVVHVELLPVLEGPRLVGHDKGVFAQFAGLDAVGLEPLLQTGLVHVLQGA